MSILGNDLSSAIKSVAKEWKKAKRHADKEDRVSSYRLARMRYKPTRETIRDAAFQVMEDAYGKASGGGRYPANARQIYYAARPQILKITGEDEISSQYFTQTLLKDYIDFHNPSWDVVWDARGHLIEPHTEETIGLGGLEVRDYISKFTDGKIDETPFQKSMSMISTTGPLHRYGAILFIEKEGFFPLLEAAKIGDRFDVAIASSKGMPVSALCDLLQKIQFYKIKAYVVHDFDKSGFSIVSTLRKGARGSHGSGEIIDLGFRIADIVSLEREKVSYRRSDPTQNLRRNGATREEMDILIQGQWWGERVELNAMTSDQFIEWLELKLIENGIRKIIPNKAVLEAAYRRAKFLQRIESRVVELRKEIKKQKIKVPKDLNWFIEKRFKEEDDVPWDTVIWGIAQAHDQTKKQKRENKTMLKVILG
jgi:hypothetical protein